MLANKFVLKITKFQRAFEVTDFTTRNAAIYIEPKTS